MVAPLPACPHCGRPAPIVYRGAEASCTACGKIRPPFTSPSVNLTGKPSMLGGSVARVFGGLALGGGTLLALVLGGLFQALFPASIFGWIVGFVILVVTSAVGFPLLLGGKRLAERGEKAFRATRENAVFEVAESRGRILTAEDVAKALAMPAEEADALLTAMAKERPDRVKLEIDDQGTISFRFARPGVRIEERVRFADEPGSVESDLEAWDERARKAKSAKI